VAHPEDTQGQGSNLTDQLTGWIHESIDTLHNRTVRPLLIAVRGVIVGTLVLIVAVVIVIALLVGLFRLFDVTVFSGRVWATDLLFGVVLLMTGCVLLRKARPNRSLRAKH
jgi:hypothetical protein